MHAFILLTLQFFTGGWIYISYLRKLVPPHGIITIPPIIGLGLVIVVLIHLYMNKKWVKMQLKL